MKLLIDDSIRLLFLKISMGILAFVLIGAGILWTEPEGGAFYIFALALGMACSVLIACYTYFKGQSRIIEAALTQITRYISGDKNARIECYENGGLYRLFYEVNSLAAILNAHAQKEGKAKEFLKNTISDISHQLKTPLAALRIYNGILDGEAKNLPTIREFVLLSEQELDRMEALVQNLLKITKFDVGTAVMDKKTENVSEMMESLKKHFSFRAAQEGKEIILEGGPDITFSCDRIWLTEAIGNIVKNALDHTKAGDYVRIEWRQFASVVQITVKDNGSGIHPEDLYHIFKRFYRSRFSKDTQGIGLGLALAKSVIEAHGGTVEADSALGGGSVFTMNFQTHDSVQS